MIPIILLAIIVGLLIYAHTHSDINTEINELMEKRAVERTVLEAVRYEITERVLEEIPTTGKFRSTGFFDSDLAPFKIGNGSHLGYLNEMKRLNGTEIAVITPAGTVRTLVKFKYFG